MFFRLLLLFVALPILELALLVKLGEVIGFWPTMGIVVVTGLLGSTLTRRQGLTVWRQFNLRLQQGQLPGTELVDGLIILVSGAFLLTPGVITDFAGFLGLIPFTRALIRRSVLRFVERQQKTGAFQVHMAFGGRRYAPPEPDNTPLEWRGTPVERPGDDG